MYIDAATRHQYMTCPFLEAREKKHIEPTVEGFDKQTWFLRNSIAQERYTQHYIWLIGSERPEEQTCLVCYIVLTTEKDPKFICQGDGIFG